jgi:glutathione S-transferase
VEPDDGDPSRTDEEAAPANVPRAPIFHLALPVDWSAAFADGVYRTSTRGLTLDDVGFIHCSRLDQVEGTANAFYADLDQLVLLTIDPDRVAAEIVHEPPEPASDERFPHLYGPLPVEAVNLARFWIRDGARWSLDDL